MVEDWHDRHFLGNEVGGEPLMPWQRLALDRQLAHVNGRLLHRQALTSTARQNGKTVDLRALIGWWLTDYAKLLGRATVVLSTAHLASLAVELFNQVWPILKARYGGKEKLSKGAEEFALYSGSRWFVRAATPKAAHGIQGVDLAVADEIWDIAAAVIDEAMLPTMRARPNPLFSAWSTAGTDESEVMIRLREQGMAQIDRKEQGRLCLTEWSPPPNVDVLDRRYWAWGNPAIGHTITMETLEDESTNPNRKAFARSALNMWVPSMRAWLDANEWTSLAVDTDFAMPKGGVLVVEQSHDEERFVMVRAGVVEGVTRIVSVAVEADELAIWARAKELMAEDRSLQLAVAASLEVHVEWIAPHHTDRYVTVGLAEIYQWTSLVKSLVKSRRIAHRGDVLMTEQVCRAVGSRSSAGYGLMSQKSPGPIEFARCLVWAVALANKPAKPNWKPGIGGAVASG